MDKIEDRFSGQEVGKMSSRLHTFSHGSVLFGIITVALVGWFFSSAQTAAADALEASTISAPLSATAALQAVQTRTMAEASLTPTAIEYYVATYGVSEAEARSRLATQTMVPNLEYMLMQLLGDGFSQLWFDNSTGQWVVAVTSSAPASEVSQLLSSVGLGDHYRIQRVSANHEQLLSAFRELSSQVAATLPSGKAVVGVGEGQLNITLAADQSASKPESAIAEMAAQSSVPVHVVHSPKASLSMAAEVGCKFPYCNTAVGGAGWYFSSEGKEFECSMGFYVTSSGDPYPLILTAGHCALHDGAYNPWYTCEPGPKRCKSYGHEIPFGYYGNGGGDAGLLEDDSFPIYPGYWNWSIGTLSTVEYYYPNEPAPDGLVVCFNGAGNGSSCGTITNNRANNVHVEGGGFWPEEVLNEMIEVQGSCGHGGDSGGSVTSASSQTAVGTDSAGNGCVGGRVLEPIGRALRLLGIVLQ
jgi:hypothetical protein